MMAVDPMLGRFPPCSPCPTTLIWSQKSIEGRFEVPAGRPFGGPRPRRRPRLRLSGHQKGERPSLRGASKASREGAKHFVQTLRLWIDVRKWKSELIDGTRD